MARMHDPVIVDEWVWVDTDGGELLFEGYDKAGACVAKRTFEFVETQALIDGEWTVVERAERDAPSWSAEEPLGEPEDYFDPRVERYECADCASGYVELLDGPVPPDPDRYGNRRFTYKCPDCGDRFTILQARHGGMQVPEGLRETGRPVDDSRRVISGIAEAQVDVEMASVPNIRDIVCS